MKPPYIKLERLEEVSEPKFIDIDRCKCKLTYPDGTSKEMVIDSVVRKYPNAVIILAYDFVDGLHIYLRSCFRPAVYNVRPEDGNRWELAAGLIEGESGLEAGSRETKEELGFDIPASDFKELGKPAYAAVGLICEQLVFVQVEVDPEKQEEPSEDGSPLEHGGIVWRAPIADVQKMISEGEVDMKTEVGVTRFMNSQDILAKFISSQSV